MADSSVMGHRWGLFWGAVGLSTVFYAGLVWRQRVVEQREQRLVSIRAKDVTGFRVVGGETTFVDLKRDGNGFVFVAPYPGVAADQRAVKNFLSVLERLPARRRWEQSGDLSLFGVGPQSPRLTVELGERVIVLAVGNRNPVGAEVFVHIVKFNLPFPSSAPSGHLLPRGEGNSINDGEIALVPTTAGALFQVQGMDFRGRRILPEGELLAWSLDRPGRGVLKAEIHDHEWMVSEGTGPVYPSDRSAARDVAQRINRLRLSDFESVDRRLSLDASGLSNPVARLTVQVSSGPAVVLTLGRGENPRVLNLAVNGEVRGGVFIDFLDPWPALSQLRKKSLVDFPLASVTRFTVERDESLAVYEKQRGKWYRLGRERRLVDPRGVQAFLLALAKVKIESFDFSGSVEVPQRRYVLLNSDGERVMDLVLGENIDGVVSAAFGGARYRFLLEASETDQWGF